MAQYIQKDILVAEIEKRKNMFFDMSKGCEDASSAKAGFYAQAQTLEGILSFLDTLEVKEVDFEKELDRIWFDNKFGDLFDNSAVDFARIRALCRHFFELGLKSHKGK